MREETKAKFDYLAETKSLIKSALIEKGQSVSDTDTFRSYADKIRAISGGGEPEITVLLEPMVIGPFTDTGSTHPTTNEAIYKFMTEQAPVRIEKGKTYIVDWRGKQYTVACKETHIEGMQSEILYLGDGSMLTESVIGMTIPAEPSDEPFVIMQATLEITAVYFFTTDEDVTHTFGLSLVSESGGISDSRIHYVTFMHDGVEIYKMPVVNTDTCHDPVTKGYISAPTKESTAQYEYAFSGWSLIDDNTVDSSALTNVTENRTVYAVMKESLRYYTITFYDGETLLKTEQIAYGGSSTYTTTKDNYVFTGWNPEPTNITGDMTCYAQFEESYTFADASWEYIADMSSRGLASQAFAIGDIKTIPVNFLTGTQNVEFMIVGFDHDDLADGSGKAGISIVSVPAIMLIARARKFTDTFDNGSWVAADGLVTAETFLQYPNGSKPYDAPTSQLRSLMNTTFFGMLPTELKNVIKTVIKKTYNTNPSNQVAYNTAGTSDKVWPISGNELISSASNVSYSGTKYEYYTNNASRQRYGLQSTGMTVGPVEYGTRQYSTKSSSYRVMVDADGTVSGDSAPQNEFYVPGFCI